MDFHCPACGKNYSLPDERRGRTLKCSACSTVFGIGDDHSAVAPIIVPPEPLAVSWQTDHASGSNEQTGSFREGDRETAGESRKTLKCSECLGQFPASELLEINGRLVCAGCKAVFLQKMQEGSIYGADGSLENAIAGNYDFLIGDILREAWQRTSGVKLPIWGGLVLVVLIQAALGFAVFVLFIGTFPSAGALAWILNFTLPLAYSAVIAPFSAGIMMMGIRRVSDLPVEVAMIFEFFPRIVPLFLAALLIGFFTKIGFYLLFLPGLYLAIAYLAAIPLIIDKNLDIWEAMESSRKGITHKWFKVFGCYLLVGLITGLSAIPFGIGLIWSVPWAIITGGVLYRVIFGVSRQHG